MTTPRTWANSRLFNCFLSLWISGVSLRACCFLLPAPNHRATQLEPDPPRHKAPSLLEDAGLIENLLFSSPVRKRHLRLLQKSCFSPGPCFAVELCSFQPGSPLHGKSSFTASREMALARSTEMGGRLRPFVISSSW